MPHGSCFFWNVPLTTLHVGSDLLIAIAYFSIPIMLFIYRQHASEGARPFLLLFAAFILSCGIGHVLAMWNIWHSAYWVEGSEKLVTGLISGYTAFRLQQNIPLFLGTHKALEETQELAKTDPLTGLANRRGLDAVVANALALPPLMLRKVPHTLMLIDLDDFKQVNDTYGHLTGDQLLKDMGQLLRAHTRSLDTVARIGGDEFVVLLQGCALTEALAIAEKIRGAIAHLGCTPTDEATSTLTALRVSASIGLTEVKAGMKLEALMDSVDKALYRSKKLGKNQICSSR